MKLKNLSKISGYTLSLFVIGIVLFGIGISLLYRAQDVSFDYVPPAATQERIQIQRISIERIGLTSDVASGTIENGTWQVSDTAAHHLISSALPGEQNNIVIYAHNTKNLFGSLQNVRSGDTITVSTSNDMIAKYETLSVHTVSPQEIEWVLPKETETLTLFTCTGFLDQKRLVVVAKPIRSEV